MSPTSTKLTPQCCGGDSDDQITKDSRNRWQPFMGWQNLLGHKHKCEVGAAGEPPSAAHQSPYSDYRCARTDIANRRPNSAAWGSQGACRRCRPGADAAPSRRDKDRGDRHHSCRSWLLADGAPPNWRRGARIRRSGNSPSPPQDPYATGGHFHRNALAPFPDPLTLFITVSGQHCLFRRPTTAKAEPGADVAGGTSAPGRLKVLTIMGLSAADLRRRHHAGHLRPERAGRSHHGRATKAKHHAGGGNILSAICDAAFGTGTICQRSDHRLLWFVASAPSGAARSRNHPGARGH